MENAGKMMWHAIVKANCRRARSRASILRILRVAGRRFDLGRIHMRYCLRSKQPNFESSSFGIPYVRQISRDEARHVRVEIRDRTNDADIAELRALLAGEVAQHPLPHFLG